MKRPTSVTVFGILNIVFAVLGVIGIFASLALLKLADASNSNNPTIRLLHDNAFYAGWFKLMIPLGLLSSAVLLAAGIGLLMLKNWARVTSIVYGVYSIVVGLAGIVMNFVFMLLPLLSQSGQSGHESPAEMGGRIGGAIGGTIGGFFGLIYPVLLLIFMTRPKVKAAFQPAAVQPAMSV